MEKNEILLKTIEKENQILVSKIKEQNCKIKEYEELIHKQKEEIEDADKKYNILFEERKNIQKQLDSILYSRSYKIIKKLKNVFGKKCK